MISKTLPTLTYANYTKERLRPTNTDGVSPNTPMALPTLTGTPLARLITDASLELYDRIINKNLLIRRITVSANHVIDENAIPQTESFEQLDLFTDYAALQKKQEEEKEALKKEKQMQQAMLSIKKKYGKNAVLKGMNLEDGARPYSCNNKSEAIRHNGSPERNRSGRQK